jgi:peptide deformylase
LREPAREVEEVDDEGRELVDRMFVTMHAADGQGLAAPQVGVSLRIAIVDVPPRKGTPHVLINPSVVAASDERIRDVEGCLSIPGVWEMVERPARVVVEARDASGDSLHLEAGGDLARCLQHEIDHLDGILYVDRLSPLARRMLLGRYRKLRRAAGT